MKRLYRHRLSNELVLVGGNTPIARHPLIKCWYGVALLLVEREISNGNLVLIGNNLRRK